LYEAYPGQRRCQIDGLGETLHHLHSRYNPLLEDTRTILTSIGCCTADLRLYLGWDSGGDSLPRRHVICDRRDHKDGSRWDWLSHTRALLDHTVWSSHCRGTEVIAMVCGECDILAAIGDGQQLPTTSQQCEADLCRNSRVHRRADACCRWRREIPSCCVERSIPSRCVKRSSTSRCVKRSSTSRCRV